MNDLSTLKPDRYATNIARAKAMHEASGNLLAALTRSAGKYSTSALEFWRATGDLPAIDVDRFVPALKNAPGDDQ